MAHSFNGGSERRCRHEDRSYSSRSTFKREYPLQKHSKSYGLFHSRYDGDDNEKNLKRTKVEDTAYRKSERIYSRMSRENFPKRCNRGDNPTDSKLINPSKGPTRNFSETKPLYSKDKPDKPILWGDISPSPSPSPSSSDEVKERKKFKYEKPTEVKDTSYKFELETPNFYVSGSRETDPHRLGQRQKQIDFGKNTIGYEQYIKQIPKEKRDKLKHPRTPDIHRVCSKRAWDGVVKQWRRFLHTFDSPFTDDEELPEILCPHPTINSHLKTKNENQVVTESEERGKAVEGRVEGGENERKKGLETEEKESEVVSVYGDWEYGLGGEEMAEGKEGEEACELKEKGESEPAAASLYEDWDEDLEVKKAMEERKETGKEKREVKKAMQERKETGKDKEEVRSNDAASSKSISMYDDWDEGLEGL